MLQVPDCIIKLNEVASKLSTKDQTFAMSLATSWAKYRRLSPKQEYWVNELVKRAATPQEPKPKVDVGNFAGVIELFHKAANHLQFPKIWLRLPDGRPIVLALAGKRSKNPGTVAVTDGGPYGCNVWYGRISPEGEWEAGRGAEGSLHDIAKLFMALSDDPVTVAAEYGKLTGNCCFCHRKLTDERSTDVGYGKVCADHFGLPWGPKAVAKSKLVAPEIEVVSAPARQVHWTETEDGACCEISDFGPGSPDVQLEPCPKCGQALGPYSDVLKDAEGDTQGWRTRHACGALLTIFND